MPVPKATPPRVEVDGRSARTGLSAVFDSSPNNRTLTEYIRWANGRRARQPNGKGKTEVGKHFELAARPFFGKTLRDRELTMHTRDCSTGIVYDVKITIPYFDMCDAKGLSFAFNGHVRGMYHWVHSQFSKVLAEHLDRTDVVIKRSGGGAYDFVDTGHGWIQNVVGLENSTKNGPLNGITQYAYHCAGFKECIVGHRFTWTPPHAPVVTSEANGDGGGSVDVQMETAEAAEVETAEGDVEGGTSPATEPIITGTTSADVGDAIRFISDTALVNPGLFEDGHREVIHRLSRLHFASPEDAVLLADIERTMCDDGDMDAWEVQAFSLNRIYVERDRDFADELVLGQTSVPVETPRLHLIRFKNLNRRYQGRLVKPGAIREFLCETDAGRDDLKAAGMVAVNALGRSPSVRFWIVNEAQLKRIMAQKRMNDPSQLNTELLERLGYQVDHLFPNQYFGNRGILLSCDTLVNYALVPRWLNQNRQFKDGYCSAKIGYVGTTGHILLRVYMVAVACSKADRIRVKFSELFERPDTCQRDETAKSVKRILSETMDVSLEKQFGMAVSAFQSNESVVTSRGQRHMDSMFKRKRVLEDADVIEATNTSAGVMDLDDAEEQQCIVDLDG